jgi:hypothetical protein
MQELRERLTDKFRAQAPDLDAETWLALDKLATTSKGYHVGTPEKEAISERAQAALKADPVASQWSAWGRSKAFWHTAVSGQSTLNPQMAVMVARAQSNDPTLSPAARANLNEILNLYVEESTLRSLQWESKHFENTMQMEGNHPAGVLNEMRTRERELFQAGLALFPDSQPSAAEVERMEREVSQGLPLPGSSPNFAQLRPAYRWSQSLCQEQRKRDDVEKTSVEELYNTINKMHSFSSYLSLVDGLTEHSPVNAVELQKHETLRGINWAGFGVEGF